MDAQQTSTERSARRPCAPRSCARRPSGRRSCRPLLLALALAVLPAGIGLAGNPPSATAPSTPSDPADTASTPGSGLPGGTGGPESATLAATLAAAPLRPAASGDRWLAVGPAGAGPATALAVDPQRPERLYLATAAGVFVSRDGGVAWQMSALPGVVALRVHPAVPRRLYAVTQTVPNRLRLWRSDDRGHSWAPQAQIADRDDDPRRFTLGALALDPRDPDTVYLAADAHRPPAVAARGAASELAAPRSEGRLWHSRDGGDTLAALPVPSLSRSPLSIAALAVEPDDLVVAATEAGVYRSADGGHTWQAASDGIEPGRGGRPPAVLRLAAPPDLPGVLVAAVAPGGASVLYGSTDAGLHWTATGAAVPTGAVLDLVVDPHDRRSVYASIEAVGVFATRGGAWAALTPGLPDDAVPHRLALAASLPRTLYAATRGGDLFRRAPPPPACADEAGSLCLEDRFRIDVAWWRPPGGAGSLIDADSGIGHAVPLTRDGGWFWFADRDSPEVAVKVLAGEPVDGRWWVSYTSLSDAGFDLRVFDVVSGRFEVYSQPPGEPASAAHVAGFPAAGEVRTVAAGVWFAALPEGGCGGDSIDLCLWGGRFEVEVDWRGTDGSEGAAVADRLSPRAGWFRFLRPGDPELFVKIEDGRAVNGHWWVFFGSLSDLGFTLRVTDRASGEEVDYRVEPGDLASHGDTAAFAEDVDSGDSPDGGFDSPAPDG